MASSRPPQNQHFGAAGPSGLDKGPLSLLNPNFIKTLADKRTTRDGTPPKRRGPKPGSKPPLTRRQELNRQAQRTHRERKELYIKALEDEVLRLKEIYSNMSHDKEKLAEENKQLRSLLAQSRLTLGGTPHDEAISNPSVAGYTSSASTSGATSYGVPPSSHTTALTPPSLSSSGTHQTRGVSPMSGTGTSHSQSRGREEQLPPLPPQPVQLASRPSDPQRRQDIDYDQAGIDFVLTLEKPCMGHMPWLVERGVSDTHEACGHALMASCPPEPFTELTSDIPFGGSYVSAAPAFGAAHGLPVYPPLDASGNVMPRPKAPAAVSVGDGPEPPQGTWELSKSDLSTLLDLSQRLDLDGEITPVMAWGMVLGHPRLGELMAEDFARLTDELLGKVRCYGFGAVMEEFEVRDALENVLSTKPELMTY